MLPVLNAIKSKVFSSVRKRRSRRGQASSSMHKQTEEVIEFRTFVGFFRKEKKKEVPAKNILP